MSTSDPTPPFTEAVPNPPTGPEAEERANKNAEAAEQRGADAQAEEYREQADQAAASPDAPPATPDAENQAQPAGGASALTPDDHAGEARSA